MNWTFADTFFLLALVNRSDPARDRARRWFMDGHRRFLTTSWVLAGFADALADASSRAKAVSFHATLLDDARFESLPADESQFDAGWKLYSSRSDKDWSLTDCISFAVMQERGLKDALTGDHHVEQAGFKALLK